MRSGLKHVMFTTVLSLFVVDICIITVKEKLSGWANSAKVAVLDLFKYLPFKT